MDDKHTRRQFIKKAMLGAGALTTGNLLNACSGDSTKPTEPTKPTVPLEARITGPGEVRLAPDEQRIAQYNASDSKGNPDTYDWRAETPNGDVDLGAQVEAELTLSQRGLHTVHVTTTRGDEQDRAEHQTQVLGPKQPYDLIFFFRYEPVKQGSQELVPSLYAMDPKRPASVRRLLHADEVRGTMAGRSITVAPDGERLVFGVFEGYRTYDLTLFNKQTGEMRQIVDAPAGATTKGHWANASRPAWSPAGRYIAYNDDSRVEGNSRDELVFYDTQEGTIIWPGDDPEDPYYHGMYTSFSPDGKTVALGVGHGFHASEGGHEIKRKRIKLFDLTNHAPRETTEKIPRTALPTEEQIRTFAEKYAVGDSEEAYLEAVVWQRPGINGLTFSPDGEWITYTHFWGIGRRERKGIVRQRVDGSGEMELLALGLSSHPTYSPDGEHIVFSKRLQRGSLLARMPAEGGAIEDLSAYSTPGANDTAPCWWQN